MPLRLFGNAGEAEGAQPARKVAQTRVGDYVHFNGGLPEFVGSSPRARPLYEPEQMDAAVRELRELLAADASPACRAALRTPFADEIRSFGFHWYQRIDFPRQGVSSTSDPSRVYYDEGSFNRLGGRLTSREACLLRPLPKWRYVEPLLPPLAGKSVLEVGSSNGFFSFRFAERGAASVTGIEVLPEPANIARWAARVLGHDNVRFLTTDFLLDLSIEPHDVVFLSEVHNHFLMPFLGLLRLVNLARETLILDTVTVQGPAHGLDLSSGWWTETRALMYHSFHLTEGMLLDFLGLVGVPPSDIARYTAPDEPFHTVYVVDTRNVAATRRQRSYPVYLQDALELKFRNAGGG